MRDAQMRLGDTGRGDDAHLASRSKRSHAAVGDRRGAASRGHRVRSPPVGARIENEVSLSERMGVSRPTMRRAMQDLVDRGLIVRQPGAGTQVVMPEVRRPIELTSLHDDLVKSGRQPRTEVLSFEIIPASDSSAMALRILAAQRRGVG